MVQFRFQGGAVVIAIITAVGNTWLQNALSSSFMLMNPICVVNTRMTARKDGDGEGLPGGAMEKMTFSTLKELLAKEGPSALFSGVLPVLILVINPILQYTFFEQLKNVVEKQRQITPTDAFYLSALGKLLVRLIMYPYITVKSRMHVAGKGQKTKSLNETMMEILGVEGWGGLYKGIGPKVSQSVLTTAFLFAFKDVLCESMVTLRRRGISRK
ncbi:hypothetical protein FQN52_007845 [Onygenales sp. PD_12]|nr:hypothetical protein FQN52_007845 [Onygenales sp. PD_12]